MVSVGFRVGHGLQNLWRSHFGLEHPCATFDVPQGMLGLQFRKGLVRPEIDREGPAPRPWGKDGGIGSQEAVKSGESRVTKLRSV